MARYDVSNVVGSFLRKNTPERRELFKEFRLEAQHNPIMRELAAEICREALVNSCTPVMCIQLGMIYGMTVGVQLEQDRLMRRGIN